MKRTLLYLLLLLYLPWSYGQELSEEIPAELELEEVEKEEDVVEELNAPEGDFAEDSFDLDEPVQTQDGAVPSTLLVEKEFITIKRTEHAEDAIPIYKERRQSWGALFSVSYGLYDPTNYNPDFSTSTFEDIYSSSGMVEIAASAKYNTSAGAFLMGLGVGTYSATATEGSKLSVIPIRLEAAYIMDTLMAEPIIAPYVLGGAYMNMYSEENNGSTVDGSTQVAPYFGLGVNFQLNWLDPEAALNTYVDYGLENTFVYIEGRTYMASGSEQDPDFSTTFHLVAGARVEF